MAHTVFGAGAPPWEPTSEVNGVTIRTTIAFYSQATDWSIRGSRLRAPASSGLGTVTLAVRITANGVMPDLSAAPLTSATVVVDAAGGWYDVLFPLPLLLTAPDVAWISLDSDDGLHYLFVAGATVGGAPIQASDASDLFMAEAAHPRGAFREGAGATTSAINWYGLDIIVEDPGTLSGDVNVDVAVGVEPAGVVGKLSDAEITPSVAVAAAGAIDGSGGSSITEQVAVVAAGVVTSPAVPNAGGMVYAIGLLSDILELLTADGSDGGCPLPCFCRVAIYPGLEVPWDSCATGGACGECDGQLYAAIQSVTRIPGDGVGACEAYNFTAIVGAVRCAAKLKDDDLNPFPSVEAVQNDAIRQAVDADGIRYAIMCCPTRPQRLKDAGIVLDSWAPLGPQDCVGGAWTIRGRFDVCC